ncbi:MAG: hypothetical protein RLZZ15_475 [Verrucomicrobiota bacterium]
MKKAKLLAVAIPNPAGRSRYFAMSSVQPPSGHSLAKWFFLIDDVRVPAPRQQISEAIVRAQASVPADRVIIRDQNSPSDQAIGDHAPVDLAQGNVFYTVERCDAPPAAPCNLPPKLAFSVDDKVEEVLTGTQTGQSLFDLFALPAGRTLFRDYESPNDHAVSLTESVQFAEGPVFYTRGATVDEVEITIDRTPHKVKAGNYSVADLKRIGGVPATLQLDQIVNGVITPLPETATVCVEGGEVFISHPRDACSS